MFIYDLNANPLNSNDWAFSLTEIFHITSFALSIGTIMVVDLRMLGLAFRQRTPREILRDTSLWTLAGLIIVIFSGLLIFSSDPFMYMHNYGFRFKIIALVVALFFNYTIHWRVARANASPGTCRLVGALSILLWVLVPVGGISIAFV